MADTNKGVTPGYEIKDINLKGLAYATLLILVVLVAIVWLLRPAFGFRVAQHLVTTSDPAVIEDFPLPRLQAHPIQDWHAFRAEEERQLTTYGWVDRERGIVRVPIAEAMDRYVRQQQSGE